MVAVVNLLSLENSSYYFYSTISQSFAAITAIIYVAAQSKLKSFEDKEISLKKTLLYKHFGDHHYNVIRVDNELNKQSTHDVIKSNLEKNDEECLKLANNLKIIVEHKELILLDLKKFISSGLLLIFIGILGLTLVPTLLNYSTSLQYGLMAFVLGFSAYQLYKVKKFVENSLQKID